MINRDNVKDVVSVRRVVWAINVVTFYRGLTVINPNIISSLRLLIHRVSKSLCAPDDYNTESYKKCSKFPPPVYRHLLTRRTVFSKTVFSIARSIF